LSTHSQTAGNWLTNITVYVKNTVTDIQQQELHSWTALHVAQTGLAGKWWDL